jgi:hypothetical protein
MGLSKGQVEGGADKMRLESDTLYQRGDFGFSLFESQFRRLRAADSHMSWSSR